MRKALFLVLATSACGNGPHYSVPSTSPAPFTLPTVTPSVHCETVDLGAYQDNLCVLGAVFGSTVSYGGTPTSSDISQLVPGTVVAPGSSTGCSDSVANVVESTSVSLYVDGTGEWQLTSSALDLSAFAALVQCVPWSNFGLSAPPSYTVVAAAAMTCVPVNTCFSLMGNTGIVAGTCGPTPDGCGGYIDCGPCNGRSETQFSVVDAGPTWQETSPVPAGSVCVLSSVGGDLGHGLAQVGDGGLFASSPPQTTAGATGMNTASNVLGAENVQVSAICFSGLQSQDVPLVANSAGIGSVPLPHGAICGLAALSGLSSPNATVSATGTMGGVIDAQATARCLIYPAR